LISIKKALKNSAFFFSIGILFWDVIEKTKTLFPKSSLKESQSLKAQRTGK